MIILINHWIAEEPDVSEFDTRQEAEVYIKENLCYNSGAWYNYDAYEGKQLKVAQSGDLIDSLP